MKPLELMEHLGGHFQANKIRATVNNKVVVLARLDGHDWVLTDEGEKIAKEVNTSVKPVVEEKQAPAKKAAPKTRKAD